MTPNRQSGTSPGESISRSTLPPHADFGAYLHQSPTGSDHRGWYKPSRLPHFDQANIYQFITYHLADSIPQKKLRQFEIELKDTDPKHIPQTRRKMMENWLDAGHGTCVLKNKPCAEIVLNAWHHFDNERYKLIAWTVMPNHYLCTYSAG